MGREQGDELGDEVAYTHADYDREEVAYTATDRVNLEARGWRPKPSKGTSKATPAASKGGDANGESGRA